MTRRSSEAGFSLIETLVALLVISGMVGMLFEAISANAQAAHGLARRREAVMLGQSLLAQAGIARGAGRRLDQGQWNGLSWRIARHGGESGARSSGVALEELRITVAEGASGRELVSVRTLRLEQ